MALAVPQTAHTAPTSGTTTVTATLLSATVVGNDLVAVVSGYDGAPGTTSMTDSRGNTWVRDYTTAPAGAGLLWYAVYSARLTAAGTPHTVTFTQIGIQIANLDVAEVSGMPASGRFEAAVLGGATGVSPYTAGPTGTLTQSDEIVFAAVAIDSGEVSATLTQDPTWVLIGEQQDGSAFIGSVVYKIVAATTPVTHVWTGTYASALWSTVILSYKGAAPVPTGVVAVTEALDVSVIAGTVTAPSGFVGTVAVTEIDDVSVIAGTFTAGTNITGTVAVTEITDVAAIAGTFTGSAPTFRYPVAVSGRKFVDQLGGVYLVKDMSSWAMCQNLTNAELTQALEGAAARHFNSINVAPCGVNVFPGSYHPYTNATGQAFFAGAPFKTAFGAAWASMDWLVDECARLGLSVICSMFGSYDDVTGISNDLLACTVAECRTYGLTLANRYITDLHVMWHVEGEAFWDAPDSRGQRYDAIFHGVVDAYTAAGRGSPLIIAEPTHTSTANSMFISRELRHGYTGGYQWLLLSANSLYQYATDSTVQFDNVWNEAGATTYPVWDCEPTYVGANRPSAGAAENQNIRERCYTVMLRGGIGINYGDEAWWPFDSPGLFSPPWTWQEAMGRQPELEAQRCWDLVDLYCADATWVPDNTSLTTGLGSGDDKAAVGHSNTALLAYFPTSRAVTVDTTVIAGTGNVRLRWYDPVLGTYATIAATEAQAPARVVTPYPGNHADGFADYVLVVDAADTSTGAIAVTEGVDIVVITGTVTAPTGLVGAVAITEATDVAVIVGTIAVGPLTGVIAVTEAGDVPVIVGFIPGAPTEPSGPLIVSVQAWPPPLTVEVTQP